MNDHHWKQIESKIQTWEQAADTVGRWRKAGERIVFTNGCFDLLHYGHVRYLAEARDLGDRLIVGLNSADSVRRLKGPERPINDDQSRRAMLAALACVDAVVEFSQDTPLELIQLLLPDVLVKGGDWKPEQIVGSAIVLAAGGTVRSLSFHSGYSTTRLAEKIKKGKG
ncbi:MAG: D-glycero-beta-D-manno-heptose 1-phosphate adenylyltransferase [Saprospiraceae bacterium]|nr:D-glycero-beta-D-manno-heptose 1-phosphate adenylyltransferase [Saprospiraceae bacterium]MCB0625799.1 D-glycero-beta-D-manno-heptose 1-phosphate adenylyltransferase [Saprospiraceae bacterium]MCB0678013.1 D-glycero-beta-D-manno-heptose 1-phosphate adenylyltransferase [Saprospiraceae bacterium]